MHLIVRSLLWQAWRLIILVFGITLVLLGLAMMVLPGPGILTAVIGVAVLAAEFAWARRMLRRAHQQFAVYYNHYEQWRGVSRPLPRVYEFRGDGEGGHNPGPLTLKVPRDWLERTVALSSAFGWRNGSSGSSGCCGSGTPGSSSSPISRARCSGGTSGGAS